MGGSFHSAVHSTLLPGMTGDFKRLMLRAAVRNCKKTADNCHASIRGEHGSHSTRIFQGEGKSGIKKAV